MFGLTVMSTVLSVQCALLGTPGAPCQEGFVNICQVVDALWANDRLHLLVNNSGRVTRATAAYAEGRAIYHWAGAEDLWDICGIGVDPTGGLIVASQWADRTQGGATITLVQFGLQRKPGTPLSKGLGNLELPQGEGFLSFLRSRPGWFITSRRVGNVLEGLRTTGLKKPIGGRRRRADISGTWILAAASPVGYRPPAETPGAMWLIDVTNGDVVGVPAQHTSSAPRTTPLERDVVYDPDWDHVRDVLAVPGNQGDFYVAIGHIGRGGRLLRVDRNAQCSVVFRQHTGPFDQIAGTPLLQTTLASAATEEPVLALARHANGSVHFATPRGVYVLDEHGPRFLCVPRYERVGDFYVAANVPGFLLVLSYHVDAPDDRTARLSDVFMVASPPRATTGQADGQRP